MTERATYLMIPDMHVQLSMVRGFNKMSRIPAKDSEFIISASRATIKLLMITAAIIVARTTEGRAPVKNA